METQLKKIVIEAMSTDGLVRDYTLENVYDAWYDEQFAYKGKHITPAVRVMRASTREFIITGLHKPEEICLLIKSSKKLLISYEDFDPCLITDAEAYIKLACSDVACTWKQVFAKTKHISWFMQNVGDPREATNALSAARALWAPKLPSKVQRVQFFKYLQYTS